ncbi:hypothetical protein [Streptococcus equi]|uniref:Flagellar FliJ protein n=3 Tax=Streptococcus equi TaxID=1336 RepID=A0ABR4RT49_STRSZ|nr:hypothetical protein [Streptococcus equi]KIS19389.1 hypothetical protein AT55_00655 [Streptococcus equi subsp. zooepidemicus Sz4is]KDE02044.1 hypothetical protein M837_01861 [Streptococcus equi subsp. zooepidemicus SzS31A1]KIS08853.1 hypothetical protein AT54_01314 [Streptococcus equi subsp. zooepidemicus Sz12is]KIS16435.1 hypothetical protein AT48_00291 [Streptococcus equi subsp. zooepidemicus SzAM60]MCD3385016.1 hypothetical protein [Streptococcus equi subsp. zooepidemicus]
MADRIVEEVAIYRKLREMDDAEQDFLRQKKAYQKREDSLSERRHVLDDLINSEYQKMGAFLKRLDLSVNAASDFFKELDRLKDQSKAEFHLQRAALEEERAQSTKTFRQEQDQREAELLDVRRAYANTNN